MGGGEWERKCISVLVHILGMCFKSIAKYECVCLFVCVCVYVCVCVCVWTCSRVYVFHKLKERQTARAPGLAGVEGLLTHALPR